MEKSAAPHSNGLVEGNNQFQQLAQHAPIAAAMFDTSMKVLFANDKWLADFKLSVSDIAGKSFTDIFSESDSGWKEAAERALAGETTQDDAVPRPGSNGHEEKVRRELRPWYKAEGEVGGLIMYILDERSQKAGESETKAVPEAAETVAQDELKRQQNYLRQVIDLNPAFIFAKDEEGKFVLVNKALADAYASKPEEMVGKSDADYNPNEEEVKAFHAADLEVIRSGKPKFIPEETVYDAETGTSRWFQTIKVPIELADGKKQLLGIATDITERKRAEEALKAQQNYLRQVIDLNPSFIFAKDEVGRFVLVNKALADAYGSTPETMIGKTDGDFNPNEDEVKAIHAADVEVILSGKPKFIPEESVYDAASGASRWFQTIKVPIELDDGSKQLLGVATDISDRRESEAKREDLFKRERIARREAEEAVRMKDLFLATMSHELRTPLNAMIGFLTLMIYSGQLSDDNTHMAERSLANSQRLLGLINNILDLSRIATGRLEIVPVTFKPRELAYQLVEDLDIQAKDKGLRLELELDENLPDEVIHDEERIIQITTNLLGNAIKFTDQGRVKLALRRSEDNLVIEVTDTGPGIPPASQHVIFDDFVQLDSSSTRRHGGAGLGLSIVNKLAILMNGSVNLTSEVGKGSKFRVELPLELAVPVKNGEL